MNLSDFPAHVQARIKRENPDAFRPRPPVVPQPARTGEAQTPDRPEKRTQSRVVVSIIGLRRRTLDDDNFNGGCKALRDSIAASLGMDDGDKRLRWQYGQLRTDGREGYLVRIERV